MPEDASRYGICKQPDSFMTVKKAKDLVGCIEKVMASRLWELITPLCLVTGEATVGVLCPILPPTPGQEGCAEGPVGDYQRW